MSYQPCRIEAKTAPSERDSLVFQLYLDPERRPQAFGISAGWLGTPDHAGKEWQNSLPFLMDHRGRLDFGLFSSRKARRGRIAWPWHSCLTVGTELRVKVAGSYSTYAITRISAV